MDQKVVRRLEMEIETSVAEVIRRLGLRHLPLLPSQLTPNYDGLQLIGRQVLCVANVPPRQIGKHQSEVLTLGVPDENENVVLLRPDYEVPIGGRLC